MKEDISIRAKVLRRLIRMATADRLIGPKIQDGTFRKKIVEPEWNCPKNYKLTRIRIKRCDIEVLTPPVVESNMVVLQLHGGGYIGKLKNIYRSFAKNYSDMRGGMKVFSVDYRVAPKYPYPAALHDAYSAYSMLLNLGYRGERIVLVGDSAGGGLCLALCAYLRDQGIELPSAMVLMSPWADLTASGSSYEENYTKDPLFGNTKESMIYNGEYIGKEDPKHQYISPMFGTFDAFPQMLIQVGSIEMLLSDSIVVTEKAKKAGCQVELKIYEGMFHVFQMALNRIPESEKAWEEITAYINALEEE